MPSKGLIGVKVLENRHEKIKSKKRHRIDNITDYLDNKKP